MQFLLGGMSAFFDYAFTAFPISVFAYVLFFTTNLSKNFFKQKEFLFFLLLLLSVLTIRLFILSIFDGNRNEFILIFGHIFTLSGIYFSLVSKIQN